MLNKKSIISFAADIELIDWLNKKAEKMHCSVSQYIRSLVYHAMEVYKDDEDEKEEN